VQIRNCAGVLRSCRRRSRGDGRGENLCLCCSLEFLGRVERSHFEMWRIDRQRQTRRRAALRGQAVRLPVATSDSAKLIAMALGPCAMGAGVVLLDLHPAAAVQEGRFDNADDARRVTLMGRSIRSTSTSAATRCPSPPPAGVARGRCAGSFCHRATRLRGMGCCGFEVVDADRRPP
jgi:hypothetical protein